MKGMKQAPTHVYICEDEADHSQLIQLENTTIQHNAEPVCIVCIGYYMCEVK